MISAAKWPLFESWFVRHARGRLERGFHSLRVAGLDATREIARTAPLLVVSNHTAWPDPLVVLVLARALRVDPFAMMDAKNLAALPFFRRVGAFGVDLGSPRDGARAVRYAASLLDRPRRAVWIFPQGTTRPVTEPLVLRGGSAAIARHAKAARVVPMAIRYEHADEERARILVSLEAPLEGGAATSRDGHRDGIARGLARLEAAARAREDDGLETVFAERRSWLGDLATRALGWLVG